MTIAITFQLNREPINDSTLKTSKIFIDNNCTKSVYFAKFFLHKNLFSLRDFTIRNRTRFATVTILPEIELSHPIFGHDSNSWSKFRRNDSIKCKLLKYQSKSLQWPDFVYKMYDVDMACEKIKKFLATLKIGEQLKWMHL